MTPEGEERGDSAPQQLDHPTAGVILIGNELLSGKIKDENAAFLAERLRELGVTLERVLVIPDRVELIGAEVRAMSERYDYVFTSGGVGPTHDDVTLEGIAAGFERTLCLDSALEEVLRGYFKEKLNDAHLRMAKIPQGSSLIWPPDQPWPVYSYQNVFIFPGVPSTLQSKFNAIAERFRAARIYLRSLYLRVYEGEIAEALESLERAHEVMVGSYPRTDPTSEHLVRVTIESRDATRVDAAVESLCDQLTLQRGPEAILRIEPSEPLMSERSNEA